MTNDTKFKPTILLVDDDQINIMILTQLLSDTYNINAAYSGDEALKLIGSGLKPNLILLDIMMPGIDGFEVCEKLKSNVRTSDIPIIFITGLDDKLNEAKGLGLGAVDYIYKPIMPEIVRARVRVHLELQQHREFMEKILQRRTKDLEKAFKDAEIMRDIIQEWGFVVDRGKKV
jgi:putative two-component system response regulator